MPANFVLTQDMNTLGFHFIMKLVHDIILPFVAGVFIFILMAPVCTVVVITSLKCIVGSQANATTRSNLDGETFQI